MLTTVNYSMHNINPAFYKCIPYQELMRFTTPFTLLYLDDFTRFKTPEFLLPYKQESIDVSARNVSRGASCR